VRGSDLYRMGHAGKILLAGCVFVAGGIWGAAEWKGNVDSQLQQIRNDIGDMRQHNDRIEGKLDILMQREAERK
jgi:hypothetical protein